MSDVIRWNDQYYILASSPMADGRTEVLKHGETFAVFDRYGDVYRVLPSPQGLYHEGTRFLSRFELSLGTQRLMMLSASAKEDNALFTVDLTNSDMMLEGQRQVPRGTLHLSRTRFLWQGTWQERIRVHNYGTAKLPLSITIGLDADFADLFEARGRTRPRRGVRLKTIRSKSGLVFGYKGLDGIIRRTHVRCSPAPKQVMADGFRIESRIPPNADLTWEITISCELEQRRKTGVLTYDRAQHEAEKALEKATASDAHVFTSNEQFNHWLNRSLADLHMLISDTPHGLYPYAGVPWFSVPFGRDGIITALQMLWMNPGIARGVLGYLAATQATDVRPEQDAEVGKILHETRQGEMAALGEIPFGRYYGSVDATPLFIVLAGAYYQRSGDRKFLTTLWPHIQRALEWIDQSGDPTGMGFTTYARQSAKGLVHQGWKDSHDSVFHADGRAVEGPVALCEVQAYVYRAKRTAADLARILGDGAHADRLLKEADALQERFERAFWCEDLGTYALALDGRGRPCRVRSSNAGHCLYGGIAEQKRGLRTGRTLLSEEFFNGWGIRTIATSEARYNPMSYHNGSVWPHDNALIADGMAAYGDKQGAMKVLTGIFDASLFIPLHRLPELFCGFSRRPGESPTLYPTACSPQAWAAGAGFQLLQACLGLQIDGTRRLVSFDRPVLPPFLERVEIRNLSVGTARLNLVLDRHESQVAVRVARRVGEAEVVHVV
ncbi:MAG: amylo-alpha-1,6-glucosidase [Nitrospira sp.]|nr:amylo-alpha-1,6-glucosidase [Nitrospira sp.]MDH4245271.1 amylo-alpha-1,6-glucosidase [Nitrospira sp.]MDH4357799.1 amylo-alpha-1,6-glucosidase [Nitrospira sp.]MDH5317924.1 amylo-alpha-1,6-glucosidase [Nitrospira sp.]